MTWPLLLDSVLFRDPLFGSWDYWYLMLIPLALLVSLVYKAMRSEEFADLPRQVLRAFLKFTVGFILLAAILWVIVIFLER